MNAVFLDAVGLLALWNEDDQWHEAAAEAFAAITRDRGLLLTTTFVLLECGNAAARRPFRQAVDRLRGKMESRGMLLTPTDDDWRQAWSAYRDGHVGGPGIVDQVSFVVMRRLNITQAFTNDRHFRAAGFETHF